MFWTYNIYEKIDQWWDSKALGQCLSVQHRHQRSAVARQPGARNPKMISCGSYATWDTVNFMN